MSRATTLKYSKGTFLGNVEHTLVGDDNALIAKMMRPYHYENAETAQKIAVAYNCHDDLAAACEQAYNVMLNWQDASAYDKDCARRALAAALVKRDAQENGAQNAAKLQGYEGHAINPKGKRVSVFVPSKDNA